MLTSMVGTREYLECVKYVGEKMDMNFEERNSGNGYLHMVCQLS